MRKADTEAVSMSELLQHTVGMVSQIQELFKRRHAVSAAVQQADHDLRTANAQLDTVKRRVALGEKVRRMRLQHLCTWTMSAGVGTACICASVVAHHMVRLYCVLVPSVCVCAADV